MRYISVFEDILMFLISLLAQAYSYYLSITLSKTTFTPTNPAMNCLTEEWTDDEEYEPIEEDISKIGSAAKRIFFNKGVDVLNEMTAVSPLKRLGISFVLEKP